MLKKNSNIRITHSLEPLNCITIQHSGVLPIPKHLTKQIVGRTCRATLDLYVGYDKHHLAKELYEEQGGVLPRLGFRPI